MIKELGHKENVIELLKEHKLGLTYKDLLEKYEKTFGFTLWGNENPNPDIDNRKNGYYYLRKLKQKRLIDTYTPVDKDNNRITEGKIIVYRLTEKALRPEPENSENPIYKSIVRKMIQPFIDYGVKILDTTKEEDNIIMEMIEENAD